MHRFPVTAAVSEVLSLLQLRLHQGTAHTGVAVSVHPVGEVLAGDAEDGLEALSSACALKTEGEAGRGKPAHAFTSPDGGAVVLAPGKSSCKWERFSVSCYAELVLHSVRAATQLGLT